MKMSPSRLCGRAGRAVRVCGLALVLAAGFGAVAALAQTPPQPGAQAPAGAPQQKRTTPKAQGAAAPAAAASSGDAGLRQRVEALEEQLVDLQVVLGTLESLAKGGGAAAAAAAPRGGAAVSGADAARIEGMETQIRALTAQVEQLSQQVRQSGGGGSSAPQAVGGWRQGAAPAPAAPTSQPSFGATTVVRDDGDPIGGLIGASQGGAGGRQTVAAAPLPPAAPPAPSAVDSAGAKQLYEAAYGHLLQQDYGAAESAFDDFLKRYPNDSLAGNAQYWLGESHYVRGQYKAAAGAFLKGYQTYGRSAKAPDSLLKLGMSLDRLGQKDAACSSFRELSTRFPTAPQHIKTRADSELKRLACA